MNKQILFFACILFHITVFAQTNNNRPATWAQPVNNLGLLNMYKVDDGVYRCEQPNQQNFVDLQNFGITEVLNLREWHSDDCKAKDADIVLHRIKMAAHNITDVDVIKSLRIIKNCKGNIVFHCRHGSDRTGLICAMYRLVFQNWSKEDALNELRNGGYGYHQIFINIPKYIESVDVDQIKEQVNK